MSSKAPQPKKRKIEDSASKKALKFKYIDVTDKKATPLPYLAYFPQGTPVEALEDQDTSFVARSHKITSAHQLVLETEKITYKGYPALDNNLNEYVIAVRNKKTSTIKLVPARGLFEMQQRYNFELPLNRNLFKKGSADEERRDNLVETFGSSRLKKASAAKKSAASKENISASLRGGGLDHLEITRKEAQLEKEAEKLLENPDIPPRNPLATQPSEIYNVDDILDVEDRAALPGAAFMKANATLATRRQFVEQYRFPSELIAMLTTDLFKSKDKATQQRIAENLFYAYYLAAFTRLQVMPRYRYVPGNEEILQKISDHIQCPIPSKILDKFVVEFGELDGTSRILVPDVKRSKAFNYAIVLFLISNECSMNRLSMVEIFGITGQTFGEHARRVGCYSASGDSKWILALPGDKKIQAFKKRR